MIIEFGRHRQQNLNQKHVFLNQMFTKSKFVVVIQNMMQMRRQNGEEDQNMSEKPVLLQRAYSQIFFLIEHLCVEIVFQSYNKFIWKKMMCKRQFDRDSDFSVKKYYRRKSIKNKRYKGKHPGLNDQFQQAAGKWNLQETKNYVEFLKDNQKMIDDLKYRRKMKIFKQMSTVVKTRSADQCRSHHQKVQKLHKNIGNIIKVYDRRIQLGGVKEKKIKQKIELVKGINNEEKKTSLFKTQDYFCCRVQGQKITVTMRADQMQNY